MEFLQLQTKNFNDDVVDEKMDRKLLIRITEVA